MLGKPTILVATFAKFDVSYSSTVVDTTVLESSIQDFMCYWRANWPGETISPKMHMLEEHVVPFLKKWKLGCGFYGEQGNIDWICVYFL